MAGPGRAQGRRQDSFQSHLKSSNDSNRGKGAGDFEQSYSWPRHDKSE